MNVWSTEIPGQTPKVHVSAEEGRRLIEQSQGLSEEERAQLLAEARGDQVQTEPTRERYSVPIRVMKTSGFKTEAGEQEAKKTRKTIAKQSFKAREKQIQDVERLNKIASEREKQSDARKRLEREQAGITRQIVEQQARDARKSRFLTSTPGRIGTGMTKFGQKAATGTTKVVGGTIKVVGSAGGELARGAGAGVGLAVRDLFKSVRPSGQAGISTRPLGTLKSAGMELLGRDNKVYVLSNIAPSRGMRGTADYDALEGTFGPQGVFTRDQAMKVMVNLSTGGRYGSGKSLYAISGRFAHLLREGYIQEVPGSQVATAQRPKGVAGFTDDIGVYR